MHYPRRQSRWERLLWWRKPPCQVCGLQWMCDEAKRQPIVARASVVDRTGAWRGLQTTKWRSSSPSGNSRPGRSAT
jgi:hypothetical protein